MPYLWAGLRMRARALLQQDEVVGMKVGDRGVVQGESVAVAVGDGGAPEPGVLGHVALKIGKILEQAVLENDGVVVAVRLGVRDEIGDRHVAEPGLEMEAFAGAAPGDGGAGL